MVGTNHSFSAFQTQVKFCATLEVAAPTLIIQRHTGHRPGTCSFQQHVGHASTILRCLFGLSQLDPSEITRFRLPLILTPDNLQRDPRAYKMLPSVLGSRHMRQNHKVTHLKLQPCKCEVSAPKHKLNLKREWLCP